MNVCDRFQVNAVAPLELYLAATVAASPHIPNVGAQKMGAVQADQRSYPPGYLLVTSGHREHLVEVPRNVVHWTSGSVLGVPLQLHHEQVVATLLLALLFQQAVQDSIPVATLVTYVVAFVDRHL